MLLSILGLETGNLHTSMQHNLVCLLGKPKWCSKLAAATVLIFAAPLVCSPAFPPESSLPAAGLTCLLLLVLGLPLLVLLPLPYCCCCCRSLLLLSISSYCFSTAVNLPSAPAHSCSVVVCDCCCINAGSLLTLATKVASALNLSLGDQPLSIFKLFRLRVI
jgi:hypothetical protein